MLALTFGAMSPVLAPTLLDPIAGTLGLTDTELGRLFGVSRQAVAQWRERGVPSARQEKAATVAAICDLLSHQLKPERIPGIARRPARAYGGLSMLEMIERDRHQRLHQRVRRSFDWAVPA
jgi:DNA-binding XRE family transcriptional regulator